MLSRALKGLQVAIGLVLITGVGCTGPTLPSGPPTEETAPSEATEPGPKPGPQLSTPAAPAPETAEELTILSVAEGEVLIMKSGSDEWADTKAGTTIEEGDALRTGEGSHALVTFFDGSTIELEAGTEIEAVELRHDVDAGITTIRLDQAIGNTLSRVKKLTDPASRYEVTTPAAVGAVRGSAMRVKVEADGTSTVVNLSGSVTVSAQGVTKDIPPGYQREVKPGEEPGTLSLPTPSEPGEDEEDEETEDYTAAIAVNKTANPTVVHDGDGVAYTYVVTNPGEVALEDVSVTDDMVGDVTYRAGDEDGDGELDMGEVWEYAHEDGYTVSDEDASPLVNVATASGSVALGGDGQATVSATDTAMVTVLRPGIGLNKTAEPTTAQVGQTVSYAYSVTNTGNAPLSQVSVTDEELTVTYRTGDVDGDEVLDVDEIWVFGSSHTVGAEDGDPLVNTATARGVDSLGMVVSAQDSATVHVHLELPAIEIELTWDTPRDDLDGHFIRPGGEMWTVEDDCHFWWLDHPPYAPDWDGSGDLSPGDPILDVDDRFGGGPELITLEVPYEEGQYRYKVHFWSDLGPTSGATATVKIWINTSLVFTRSKTLQDGEVWDCAYIEWPSGVVHPGQGD